MKVNLNMLIAFLLSFGMFLSSSFLAIAQCPTGQVEVYIVVNTDAYGSETYWELTATGNACGSNIIASGGNPTMDCNSAGLETQDPSGYPNNTAITEGPFCLSDGGTYSIHWIDDWGDGTAGFDVLVNGEILESFPITMDGASGTYNFTAMEPLAFNASVGQVTKFHPEYTKLPFSELGTSVPTGITVENLGTDPITNVTVDVSVSDGVNIVHTETLGPVASIPVDGSSVLDGVGFMLITADIYTASYTVNIAETDGDPMDNTTSIEFEYLETQSRDNGVFVGALGIGLGNEGQLGQEYNLTSPRVMTGVTFVLGAPVAGETVTVDVFDFTTVPNQIIASSEVYVVDNANDSLPVTVLLECPVEVSGNYVLILNESNANSVDLFYSNDIYIPFKTWVDFPGNPNGGWSNAEDLNFPGIVFMLRAEFGESEISSVTQNGNILTANQVGATYQWLDCDNGNAIISGETSQVFTAAQEGNYAVEVNLNGCILTSDCSVVCITSNLGITQTGNTLMADQTGASYQWVNCDNNNAMISGATSQSFSPTETGNYAVEIAYNGCTAISSCSFACIPLNVIVNENGNTLNVIASSGATYQWLDCDNNNAIIPGAINPTFTPSVSGNYALEINTSGCISTSTCYQVCIPTSVVVTQSANLLEGTTISGASYQWVDCGNNNAIISGATSSSYTVLESGSYALVINTNGCAFISNCNPICIPINIIVNETDETLEVNPVTGATYQWLDCDNGNTMISGATSTTFSPTETGNYAIEINDNGCISTSGCYSLVVVGLIKNDLTEEITIAPNPTNGKFSVNLGKTHAWIEAKIINTNGQEIQKEIFTNTEDLNLEIKGAAGFYFLEISTADNKKAIIKIVKK